MLTTNKSSRITPLSVANRDSGLVSAPRGGRMLAIRSRLGLSRETFARLVPVSTRSLATVEAGEPAGPALARRLIELRRIVDGLAGVMAEEFIGEWLGIPNAAFDGLKPLEVIERGETDRIWRMIHLLESGQPG